MATNNILSFCAGANPNVTPIATWQTTAVRSSGFVSGIAISGDVNAAIVGGANIAHAVGEFIKTQLDENVNATDDVVLVSQFLRALQVFIQRGGACPIGSIIPYLGSDVPYGWLLANGASLSRTEYPELFDVIGTKCGSADSAHFSIPDMHHRFLEGTTVLSEIGKYIAEGLPNIKGTFRLRTATLGGGSISKIGWASGAITDDDAETGTSSAISTVPVTATQLFNFSANRSTQVFGASNTVQPSAMRALVLIRAF